MKLLTQAIAKSLPARYSQEELGLEAVIRVKFFTPDSCWTWYATEYDPEDCLFFGFVTSSLCPDGELGYFSLDELERARGRLGLPVERDLHWTPKTLAQVMADAR